MITIGMADDHAMLRQGLANMIESFGDYKVIIQTSNGKEMIDALRSEDLPDIVLLDISMPIMDGFETASIFQENFPSVKVLALSMMDNENAIIRMVRNGARGYILKDAEPSELKQALLNVVTKGYHYTDLVTGKLIFNLNHQGKENNRVNVAELSSREIDFLRHSCTEMTYKEIAGLMHLSPRTVDGYRDQLFEKLGVKTRVGLVIFAIKNQIVKV